MANIFIATSKDIESLVKLQADSFALGLERLWSAEDFKTTLATKGMTGLLYKHEGNDTAFLLFRQIFDEAEIILLGVDTVFQRRGYASKLLQHAIELMHHSDIAKVFLEVREDNFAAIYFYEMFGFEEVGERKAYYHLSDGQRKNAKIYSLSLY